MISDAPSLRKAVFDCSLFLQAVLKDTGPAFACFRMAEEARIVLVVSDAVMDEVRDVLSRPKLRRKHSRLTASRVLSFLERVAEWALHLDEVPESFRYPRDPDDEPYLNLAIASGAAYLVTWDRDLLDLQNPQSVPGQDLRRLAPQLAILDPVEFLRLVDPPASTPSSL